MPKKTKAIPDNREERTFGETLYWHFFIFGTRPDGSPTARTGKIWDPKQAASAVGVTIRGFWNWIDDRHLPYDTTNVEKALFGDNPAFDGWREELRRLLREGRGATAKPSPTSGKFPAVITGQAVTVHTTPFEVAEVDGPVTEADFRAVVPRGAENFGNSRKNRSETGGDAPFRGTVVNNGNASSGNATPASRKTVAMICAAVLAVLGIYSVKRSMEDRQNPKTGPVVIRPDLSPVPPVTPPPVPQAEPIKPIDLDFSQEPPKPTEQERRAAAEKKRQDDLRTAAQKKTLDELEELQQKKLQAAKDQNAKLRVMAKGDDPLCKVKLEELSVPGFTLKCDTQMGFGQLVRSAPASQTASSLADCAARCRRASDCVAFSFDAGAHAGSASCYLAGSTVEERRSDNWIAGVKDRR